MIKFYFIRIKDINFKNAGIFDFYRYIFNNLDAYSERIGRHYEKNINSEKMFNEFRTYQISDHLPLWLEMNTDHTDNYLSMLKDKSDRSYF